MQVSRFKIHLFLSCMLFFKIDTSTRWVLVFLFAAKGLYQEMTSVVVLVGCFVNLLIRS
jgi:hypothetical protein